MCWVNLAVLGNAVFDESKFSVIIPISFWIVEVVLIVASFVKTCKFKLISNIILGVLCIIDTGMCIFLLTEKVNCIVELVLDLVFIYFILYNITNTYKKLKNDTEAIPQ